MRTTTIIMLASVLTLAGCAGTATGTASTGSPVSSSTTSSSSVVTASDPRPTAEPEAESVDSCDYLLDPHYRFVGQSEITNTGNVGVVVVVDVTWKQVGAKAIAKSKTVKVEAGAMATVNFDVKASSAQISQIQAYEGSENCTVKATISDTFGEPTA